MQLIGKGKKSTTVSSILNTLGLTAAFAALYIILVQVHHDFSYNRAIPDSDRIWFAATKYTNEDRFSTYLCRPLGEAIVDQTPGVEAGGTFGMWGHSSQTAQLFVETGDGTHEWLAPDLGQAISVCQSYFSLGAAEAVGLELLAGSWDNMTTGQDFAISESLARRTGLQPGDRFALRDNSGRGLAAAHLSTVAAVYRDVPKNSFLNEYDLLSNLGDEHIDDTSEWSYTYLIRLAPGVSAADAEQAINNLIVALSNSDPDDDGDEDPGITARLYSLNDSYFDTSFNLPMPQGSKITSVTLLIVAVLVVLIAFINYINFFFAQVPIRLRGINTRKIFGCSRSRLVASLVGESVRLVAVSLLLGALVVLAFEKSSGAQLISTSIAFGKNLPIVLLTVALGVAIAVAASLYPALYLTSFAPAFALKGSMGSVRKGKTFRTALIGLQFTVSMVLIICAIFVDRQHRYMLRHDLGFDQEQLLTVEVTWTIANQMQETVEAELLRDPDIRAVTWADGPLVAGSRMSWGRMIDGRYLNWECYPVSWNFLQFMGIEVVEGRDFLPSDEQSETGLFIFNQTAAQAFGLHVGERRLPGHIRDAEVVGICKDFNHTSLRRQIRPFSFYVWGKERWRPCMQLFVRTEAGVDLRAVIERIRGVLHGLQPTMPADYFEVRIFDDTLHDLYYNEQQLAKLIILFTLLAIAISLMGVFGLVMFETEYRRKEIGIRRVNGATVEEILAMFNRRFVLIVGVCFVVAVPVAWRIVDRYLENFTYRTPMALWIFLAALLAVLSVTVAVVTLRSWRAATANPVNSIKNE